MPMHVGDSFTYEVNLGMEKRVVTVHVARRIPIADVLGYELQGEMGASRLVWKGGQLLTDAGPYGRLDPPLALINSTVKPVRDKDKLRVYNWTGVVTTLAEPMNASAKISNSQATVTIGPSEKNTVHSVVEMKIGAKEIRLESWYAPGTGMVKQEQWTGARLNYSAQLLNL